MDQPFVSLSDVGLPVVVFHLAEQFPELLRYYPVYQLTDRGVEMVSGNGGRHLPSIAPLLRFLSSQPPSKMASSPGVQLLYNFGRKVAQSYGQKERQGQGTLLSDFREEHRTYFGEDLSIPED